MTNQEMLAWLQDALQGFSPRVPMDKAVAVTNSSPDAETGLMLVEDSMVVRFANGDRFMFMLRKITE